MITVPLEFKIDRAVPPLDVLDHLPPFVAVGIATAHVRVASQDADGTWHAYTISGRFLDGEIRAEPLTPRDLETAQRVSGAVR